MAATAPAKKKFANSNLNAILGTPKESSKAKPNYGPAVRSSALVKPVAKPKGLVSLGTLGKAPAAGAAVPAARKGAAWSQLEEKAKELAEEEDAKNTSPEWAVIDFDDLDKHPRDRSGTEEHELLDGETGSLDLQQDAEDWRTAGHEATEATEASDAPGRPGRSVRSWADQTMDLSDEEGLSRVERPSFQPPPRPAAQSGEEVRYSSPPFGKAPGIPGGPIGAAAVGPPPPRRPPPPAQLPPRPAAAAPAPPAALAEAAARLAERPAGGHHRCRHPRLRRS
ncbi:unnamed protein product [Polarella glacialis]|uniref:Uncharacterized protein n=1 Tax=Polarella glacialis TaxID=89957 RepID=A0A813GBZ0_POLGL|nr:unnamed protein product [Polarella glacialis]